MATEKESEGCGASGFKYVARAPAVERKTVFCQQRQDRVH